MPEKTKAEPEVQIHPKRYTMADLMAEYFPDAKAVSGGVLAGLQRELRRRNRKIEKGY